ncbi:MAG: HypC/HybG/HupF family hydrogenase formation chaperone [Pirellulales bacterium]|nr:HypC/HybG/HupF family hydrogenase formation chaperone [Pirellulales bacterium]
MCLGIPGQLTEVYQQDTLPMGKVNFGGISKDVCLAYTPDARVGQYVLVHVGFAISQIDEAEAQEIFTYLRQIEEAIAAEEAESEEAAGEEARRKGPPEDVP